MVVVINPSEGKPSMGKSIRNLTAVTRVGLDLAKRVFQVHAVEAKGEIVMARRLTRSQLSPFFAELPPCVVAMEACSSAHHWGRALIALGHEVRLLPPAHVKPYVRRNKNDAVDAAAIYGAMSRPGQRFVPVRSIDNQAELMRHRARASCSPASARRRSMLCAGISPRSASSGRKARNTPMTSNAWQPTASTRTARS
jgi:Transposase